MPPPRQVSSGLEGVGWSELGKPRTPRAATSTSRTR